MACYKPLFLEKMQTPGIKLLPLDLDTLYKNIKKELSDCNTIYIIRQIAKYNYSSKNEQDLALYDIIRKDLDLNISIRLVSRYNEVNLFCDNLS